VARRLSRRLLAQYVADGLSNGDKKVVTQLAAYLIENRRTKEAALVTRDVEFLLAQRGTILGTITSAFPLEKQTLAAIETSIASTTKADRVTLTNEVDEALIGGYVVTLPGRELDQSIRRALTVLRTRLKKV
jgi:F-type H+-transporting ATPase subunit delta